VFFAKGQYLLMTVGGLIILLALWLVVEAYCAVRKLAALNNTDVR
jgi:hypothetical protein